MDLTPQFLADYRAVERRNAELQEHLDSLRTRYERIADENQELRRQATLWRRRYEDVVRER